MLALLAGLAPPADAVGMRAAFREAAVELAPGGRGSLSALAGGPLRLVNTGGEALLVELSAEKPRPGSLRDGFEPVPDPGWIKLLSRRLELAPGGAGEAEVELAVPEGASRSGGQFQAELVARGVAPSGLGVTLRTRLYIRVRERPERLAEGGGTQKLKLFPAQAERDSLPLGRRVELPALKLVNAGAEPVETELSARAWLPAASAAPPLPNPAWLSFERTRLSLEAESVAPLRVWVEIPDQPRYRGRSWSVAVCAEAADRACSRLILSTEGPR